MDRFESGRPVHSSRLPTTRRWSNPRPHSVIALSLSILGLIAALGLGVPSRVRGWVHGRPSYRWTTDSLILEPPPPGWIKSGASGLVQPVRPALARFDGGSSLDLDLAVVSRAFKHLKWIDQVDRVELVHSATTVVHLEYRRPVAFARFPVKDREGESRELIIDREAVLLPTDEIDREALAYFLPITGLIAPSNSNPGVSWSGNGDIEPDPIVLAAARLAAFLVSRLEDDGWPLDRDGKSWRIERIQVAGGASPRIYLFAADGTWTLWDASTSPWTTDERELLARWQMLREWVARARPTATPGTGYVEFTDRGAEWRDSS